MQTFLKEEFFKSNVLDLQRRGFSDYLFVQIGNRRGFVVSKNIDILSQLSKRNYFSASIRTSEKVPLYQQDMQMRMGRKPESTKDVVRIYNVRILDKCRDNYMYSVWSVF